MPADTVRLQVAAELMQEAEHSSEAAIRSSFSRAYYAVFHVGQVVTGRKDHGNIYAALRATHPTLGKEYDWLRDRRNSADYNPDFLQQTYGSGQSRLAFKEDLERARRLFDNLVQIAGEATT